jgi:DNA polymerase IIIc chi subunit
MTASRVIFLQVRENLIKLQRIVEISRAHFQKKEPILIFVEDEKAAQFVDELLWKMPETSFLPHIISEASTTEWVVITKGKKNLNQAKIAFNLCPQPLLIEGPFKTIYQFEDLTSSAKKNLSALRFEAYKQAGLLIEAG